MSWDGERPIGADGGYPRFTAKCCRTCSEWVECPYGFCNNIGWCRLGEEFTMSEDGDEDCWEER